MKAKATEDVIQKPWLSILLGFGIAVAYIPGWIGAAIPTGWLFLIVTMPIVFVFCKLLINDITNYTSFYIFSLDAKYKYSFFLFSSNYSS